MVDFADDTPPWLRGRHTDEQIVASRAPAPRVVHGSLMERTRQLLRESGKSLPEVYADLHARGSDIGYFWLRKFSSGNVQDPSVNKVEQLYTYLTGKPIFEEV
jgi:hypothetical protein